MRRPLCACFLGLLAVQTAFAFLPQAVWLPLAVFFVLGCLGLRLFGGALRGYGLCLLWGALLGGVLCRATAQNLQQLNLRYDGQIVRLTALVERVSASYSEGSVCARLRVEQVDGERTDFRCLCVCMPSCEPGDRIEGRFVLAVPDETGRREDYADGVTFTAVYQSGLQTTGQSPNLWTWLGRLQQRLSAALRRLLDEDTGGALAAMVVGDRSGLSSELNASYRMAGLSHVLVVSGMHVSILCGDLFAGSDDGLDEPEERPYGRHRVRSLCSALLTILLMGITGFTTSVVRAGAAMLISALGVWLFAAPDALTSLAVAGLLLTLNNSYVVCDVGVQLSFTAVLGTLAGAECARRVRAAHKDNKARKRPKRRRASRLGQWAGRLRNSLWKTALVSLCASAATFPVLVLNGMSVSVYALVSGVAVLWMVKPILLLGLGAAFAGLVPLLRPLYFALSFCAGLLTFWLNDWARMAASWPGAQIYFSTGYAAAVCLLLLGLCFLAVHWRVRLRVAAPAIVLIAAAAFFIGNDLSRDVVTVRLVGSSSSPAVVITQNEQAIVLFRGGSVEQRAVESWLECQPVENIVLLVDLRMTPSTQCTLEAEQRVEAASMERYRTERIRCGQLMVEVLRTYAGCAVRLTVGNRQLVTASGSFQLAQKVSADYLLASPARPDAFAWDQILTLSDCYSWMEQQGLDVETGSTLCLRPDGGAALR